MKTLQNIDLFKGLEHTRNIYSLKITPNIYSFLAKINGQEVCLTVEHDGYIPSLSSDRDYSYFNEYLSNLSNKMMKDYKDFNKIKSDYDFIAEVYSDSKGKIVTYCKSVDK